MAKKEAKSQQPGETKSKGERTKYQKFESVEIHRSQIKRAPYNPRQMSPSAKRRLKRSLENPKIGLVNSLIVNKRTGNLVGGHQRLEQIDALEGGTDYKLSVDLIDVPETIEKEINIMLNNPTLQGQFDIDMLEELIVEINEAEDGDPARTGFSTSDMHAMFSEEFLNSVFADQVEAESPIIDTLNEMREAGKEEEAARHAAAEDDTSRPIEGEPTKIPEIDLGDGETESQPTAAEPTKEDFSRQRKEFVQSREEEATGDFMLTIVFPSDAPLRKFINHYKLDPLNRYIDAVEFKEALNLNVDIS